MNTENFGSSERLVTAAYVRQGAQGRRGHELLLRALLEQVTGPAGGGSESGAAAPPSLRLQRSLWGSPPPAAPLGAGTAPRPFRTPLWSGSFCCHELSNL